MRYAQLHTTTNFTFLTGASHPGEYVDRAHELGYDALAITDECSLAGVVKAFVAAEALNFKLIIGSRFRLSNGMDFIAIAPSRIAYAELSGFITLARRRAEKGSYEAHFEDLRFRLQHCLMIWIAKSTENISDEVTTELKKSFKGRLWIGINHQLHGGEQHDFERWLELSNNTHIPLVACGEALMHSAERKPLQDIVTAIRHNISVQEMGTRLELNGEAYLKSMHQLARLYPQVLLDETCAIADLCQFSMQELRYQYPRELVPENSTPIQYLRHLVTEGKHQRWPEGVPESVEALLEKELELIEHLEYEYYFLTVHDIVRFARSRNILCQGRGSAANSVVCYCLFITEISPGQIGVLFERFISFERDEPPDIDVDFEHQRREEVIQYIYQKYGRERAAIAAVVITYRSKSAVRDVGRALGMDESLINHVAKNIAWWDQRADLKKRIASLGIEINNNLLTHFFSLIEQIYGFPRHLSQHTGGFVISESKISDLVPLENASMPDRTIIQWDKDDLESMRLLKVDVLALGMLSALRRSLELIASYDPVIRSMQDIPKEDPATYNMLCRGDSVGVFQIESRAQMAMLPRLRPKKFYDLVVQIAIVRPGPIQGDMVHPYLRRRSGEEAITYPNDTIKSVLEPTLGVPIFQEQVMKLSMVAAGFTGGEADKLRRAMAAWKSHGDLTPFRDKLITGMLERGHDPDFAERLYQQICGFGGYGFPESHAASFALLVYVSAWIKRHHPAAFYCALLNSQPMGFYSPSQLVQDAQRHKVTVLAPDVNHSHREHTLQGPEKHLRLGLRIIQGLSSSGADRIHQHRPKNGYQSAAELRTRAGLNQRDMELLAGANAMPGFTSNRHQAYWQLLEHEDPAELFANETMADYQPEPCHLLPEPTEGQNVLADYSSQGLTLQRHPLALLREQGHLSYCLTADQLKTTRPGIPVQVAGLVTGRQRPGTASGVTFVTLEDETGNINVVVWLETARRQRKPLLTARLLHVKGVIEKEGDIVHVMAGKLSDLSHLINSLPVSSRDFH